MVNKYPPKKISYIIDMGGYLPFSDPIQFVFEKIEDAISTLLYLIVYSRKQRYKPGGSMKIKTIHHPK